VVTANTPYATQSALRHSSGVDKNSTITTMDKIGNMKYDTCTFRLRNQSVSSSWAPAKIDSGRHRGRRSVLTQCIASTSLQLESWEWEVQVNVIGPSAFHANIP